MIKKLQLKVSTTGTATSKSQIDGINASINNTISSAVKMAVAFVGIQKSMQFMGDGIKIFEQYDTQMGIIAKQFENAGKNASSLTENLQGMTKALSVQTGVSSVSLIKSAALTSNYIKNAAVIKRSIPTLNDWAASMGIDMVMATQKFNKAMADPVAGLTLLNKAGVTLTESQEGLVTQFAESGKKAEAYNLVLGVMEKKFGGTAKSTANFSDQLKIAGENLKLSFGENFLKAFSNSEDLTDGIAKLTEVIAGLGTSAGSSTSFVLEHIDAIAAAAAVGATASLTMKAYTMTNAMALAGAKALTVGTNAQTTAILAQTVGTKTLIGARLSLLASSPIVMTGAAIATAVVTYKAAEKVFASTGATAQFERFGKWLASTSKKGKAYAKVLNSITEADEALERQMAMNQSTTDQDYADYYKMRTAMAKEDSSVIENKIPGLKQTKMTFMVEMISDDSLDTTSMDAFSDSMAKARLKAGLIALRDHSSLTDQWAEINKSAQQKEIDTLRVFYDEKIILEDEFEEKKAGIVKKYADAETLSRRESIGNNVAMSADYVGQIASLFSGIYQNQIEGEQLSQDAMQETAEYKNASTERQGEMDEEYNAKIKSIKHDQFNADKVATISSIVMNTASAIVQALPNIPLSIVIGGMGAAQGIIAGAQPNPYHLGGDFIVPNGYPNDTYPINVESGEHVQITPANQSGGSNDALSAKIDRLISVIANQKQYKIITIDDITLSKRNDAGSLRRGVWNNATNN